MASEKTRLVRLLDRGFYPQELPPTFNISGLGANENKLSPPIGYVGSTTFFHGATHRATLRKFGIINPINYLLLSRFIASEWGNISKVYDLSKSSGSRPKFPPLASDGRAVTVSSLGKKRESQRHLASSYPTIVSLDINRFYESIYSHSIPWAALGKKEAKRRHIKKALKGHWSDSLDRLIRNCNQSQTVGIAIGPDTSRIVSEIILARLDHELAAKGSGFSSKQIFHNIDDYNIGVLDTSLAEEAHSLFVRTIAGFELRPNDFKTEICSGLEFAPSNFQREFDVLSKQADTNFVEHLFELLYRLSPKHPNSNVVGYALKRFSRRLAGYTTQAPVKEYLQRLLFAEPHQVRWILPLLLGIYKTEGTSEDTKRILNWGCLTCSRRNDIGSVLWFLYGALSLSVRLDKQVISKCLALENVLVDVSLMHGRSLGSFSFPVKELRDRYALSTFADSAWLILYEVERHSWDGSMSFSKIGKSEDEGNLYQTLLVNGVSFYSTEPSALSITSIPGWSLSYADFQEHDPDDHWPDWINQQSGYEELYT